jgi:hypothetical protein
VKTATLYNQEDPQEWSRYGDNLIYINAALWDHFRHERNIRSSGTDGSPGYEQFREMSVQLQERLRREGASVRVGGTVQRVLQMAQESNGSNPVDYNLE